MRFQNVVSFAAEPIKTCSRTIPQCFPKPPKHSARLPSPWHAACFTNPVTIKLRDARTLSPEALFERRKQAILLFQQGTSRIAIARVVGVHRTVVGEWVRAWLSGGEDALRTRPGGRPRGRGKSIPVSVIADFWLHAPDSLPTDHGIDSPLWSIRSVRDWILRRTGKSIPVRTTTNYLHAWGLRPPVGPRGLSDAFQDWLRLSYRRMKPPLSGGKRPVWWLDSIHITAPATAEPLHVLMAATSLGSARFLPLRNPADSPAISRFLDALHTEAASPVTIIIPQPCAATHPGWTTARLKNPAASHHIICPAY